MEGSAHGVASLNNSGDSDNMSVEDYSNLDISFDDIGDIGEEVDDEEGPGFFQKPAASNEDDADYLLGKPTKGLESAEYILGTLIVRVVAARDLEPVNGGGIGKMLFGGNSLRSSGTNRGSANPYASVRFGTTTQRTSEVFDTRDPIWPRGETMYMDVLHSALPDSVTSATEYRYEPNADDSDPLKSKAGATKSVPHATVSKASAKAQATSPKKGSNADPNESWEPILTAALFHANEIGKVNKYNPSKKGGAIFGDSDDQFLGMTAIDLTQLLTGKVRTFDEWLPLTGSDSARACVRIVCEYEASDATPRRGDTVRFSSFCHPADLYPLQTSRRYRVEEVDGDDVLVSYTSPEGWVSSFMVHRFMVVCEERHQAAIEMYQDELASIKDRLAHSPMFSVVTQGASRVPDEGLLTVANDAIQGGMSLLNRWFDGGVGTAVNDLSFATNWDGRFNPDLGTSLATLSTEENDATQEVEPKHSSETEQEDLYGGKDLDLEPLPNMPSCPITGEPMRDPVVAADGHTYERSAIARWLGTSDKSPLTGSILPHKNLVPNYMLLSSLQDAVKAPVIIVETVMEEDDDLESLDTL